MPIIPANCIRVIFGFLRISRKMISWVDIWVDFWAVSVSAITPKINSIKGVHPVLSPLTAIAR